MALVAGLSACDGDTNDTSAPTVLATRPASGVMSVPSGQPLAIEFSESMDQEFGSLRVTPGDLMLGPSEGTWDTAGRTLTFAPPGGAWPRGVQVKAVVGTDFRDAAGNTLENEAEVTFDVRADAALVVTTAAPAEAQAEVNADLTEISLDFSAPVDGTQAKFTLYGPGSLGAITWEGARARLAVSGLMAGHSYSLALDDVRDMQGNKLDPLAYLGNGRLDFSTAPDISGPTVVKTTPAAGVTLSPTEPPAELVVQFSEPVDWSTARAVASRFGQELPLAVRWAYDGLSASISLATAVAPDATVTISLLDLVDRHGNPLISTQVAALVFAPDLSAPHVVASTPNQNEPNVYPAEYTYLPLPPGVDPAPPYGASYHVIMKLTFSTEMDPDATTVSLQRAGAAAVTLDGEWDDSARVITITTPAALEDETTYRLDFSGLRGVQGDAMQLDDPAYPNARLTFTTGVTDTLLNHACIHVQIGPFGTTTAASTSAPDNPPSGEQHTNYTITLPQTETGAYLGYTRLQTSASLGDDLPGMSRFVLFLSKNETLAVRNLDAEDAPWVEVNVEPAQPACYALPSIVKVGDTQTLGPVTAGITHRAVLILPEKTSFSLRWGESDESKVVAIVERDPGGY